MKKNLLYAFIIFLVALVIYRLSALTARHFTTPKVAYFDQLADSFLHGRAYLLFPKVTYDLTQFEGKWYVPFLPLPALLLIPWVGLFGLETVNTVLFGCVIGGCNSALVFLLLQAMTERHWSRVLLKGNLGLTLLFGLGSVHWYMVIQGSVWFLAQICITIFMLLSLWMPVKYDSAILSGLALGLALVARPTVLPMFILLLAIHVQHGTERKEVIWPSLIKWGMLTLIPIVVCIGAILWYNQLRFQNPYEFGYRTQNVNPKRQLDLLQYGQFNLHYLPKNLRAMLFATPVWDSKMGMLLPSTDGMSIFLTTPAFILLLRSFKKNSLAIGGWASIIFLLIPLLLYYNTGWKQFGYRFSLDIMPVIMILFALAVEAENLNGVFWILIVISILMNAWGAWWFQNPLYFR
jgi:hypothetical protein